MTEAKVVDLNRTGGFRPAMGVLGRAIFGRDAMLVHVTFVAHAEAPPHVHDEEQFGLVVAGELRLTLGDTTHRLGPGQGYYVPPGVTHSAIAGAMGCTGVEVFSPIRADYHDALVSSFRPKERRRTP
ncbi:hypothetical protein JCM18899A_53810 [Nocardioides sp. AN3]